MARRFNSLRSSNEERSAELRRLFAEAGCDGNNCTEVPLRSSKLPNIICRLPGRSKQTVVAAAHFDRRRGHGEGAIDNWTGASLLPSLFETLRAAPRQLTYEFVAFTDEEVGLIGSRVSPFVAWKVPAIDFHSLTRDTIELLQSKRDVRTALDRKSSYDHYRFLSAYLAYLDSKVEASR